MIFLKLFSRIIYTADNLCYSKTKNSLKKREKRQKIKQAIKEKVMSINDHAQLRQNFSTGISRIDC